MPPKPLLIAHRGASADAPENTLAAFELAWQQGADGIESDWRLTADGQLVCHHDAAIRCYGDVLRPISSLTSQQVKQQAAVPPASLKQVLKTVPAGKLAVLELKEGPDMISALCRELSEASIDRQQLLVIAFQPDTVAACKQALPQVRCHWLVEFERTPPAPALVSQTLKATGAGGVGFQANRSWLTSDYLQQTSVSEWHVWTVDHPADAQYFAQLGALAITTNRPGWLRAQLAAQ